ncbi:MAG: hypothetical protein FWE27_01890 [Defluviitaleaceae bacterium]|nr:hypothetical protein [Defluviitaleaceae bacterium]
MDRKLPTRVICLVLACAVLAGAITVSAVNGSPYEQLKNAAIDAMFFENFTMEGEAVLRLNGEILEHDTTFESRGDTGRLSISSSGHISFNTGELSVSTVSMSRGVDNSGRQWYQVRSRDNWENYSMFGDVGRDSNYVRFMELALDLVVGDLRHNVSMSQRGGTRHFSGEITGSQLPEIVKLLIDIANEEGGIDIEDIEVRSFAINRIRGEASVDSDGNLTYAGGNIIITLTDVYGANHTADAEFTLRFSDIGTSNPQSPVPGLVELFTPEFMEANTEWNWSWLYFTLDADGNIDRGSITDQINRDRFPSRW